MQRKKVAVETTSGQHVNSAASPGDLHKLFEQALNSGDQARPTSAKARADQQLRIRTRNRDRPDSGSTLAACLSVGRVAGFAYVCAPRTSDAPVRRSIPTLSVANTKNGDCGAGVEDGKELSRQNSSPQPSKPR